ncbi:MAG: AN1-type zinc finger domain-containing protein [Candidatus Bathyarchaeia archaeon]
MHKCERCGKEIDLPFKCKFCERYFCLEHGLPENTIALLLLEPP